MKISKKKVLKTSECREQYNTSNVSFLRCWDSHHCGNFHDDDDDSCGHDLDHGDLLNHQLMIVGVDPQEHGIGSATNYRSNV